MSLRRRMWLPEVALEQAIHVTKGSALYKVVKVFAIMEKP
jgi:hypothetical protein